MPGISHGFFQNFPNKYLQKRTKFCAIQGLFKVFFWKLFKEPQNVSSIFFSKITKRCLHKNVENLEVSHRFILQLFKDVLRLTSVTIQNSCGKSSKLWRGRRLVLLHQLFYKKSFRNVSWLFSEFFHKFLRKFLKDSMKKSEAPRRFFQEYANNSLSNVSWIPLRLPH